MMMRLKVGNLVVDRPAARRMIMHSIPKNQIVPNSNVPGNSGNNSSVSFSNAKGAGQKRDVEEISSDESGADEVPPTKKSKQSGL
jgi:hypothetical protein